MTEQQTEKSAHEMPFSRDQLSEKAKRLNAIYTTIDSLPDEPPQPHNMARKITLYNTAQGIIGDFYAQAVYDHGLAYIERKEQFAIATDQFFGTQKEKEAYAEKTVAPFRRKETKAKAEMARWEKAYNQTEQLANAIKHEFRVLFDDYKQGGRPQ